jgi:riboflavin biosynthesis pyrimidine reductase
MVMSVDGAGAFAGRTRQISDPADQLLLRHLRGHADAVLVGSATIKAERYGPVDLDDAVTSARLDAGYAATPPLVVVSARMSLSADLRAFSGGGATPIVVTTKAGAAAAGDVAQVAEVVVVGDDEVDLRQVLAMLTERGLHRVLCEGGPYLLSQLVERDLVDDMCLTVSPYLAGAQPTSPQPASARDVPTHLTLRHVLVHDDLLYLRYARP